MNDTSRQNVVDIGQYGKARAAAGPATGISLINDCRDLTANALVEATATVMDKAVDEMFAQAEKSLGADMRNLYMQAMDIARDQKAFIQGEFKHHFIQAFNQRIRRGKSTQPAQTLSADMELSLLDPDELEESLAANNIANNIHGTCAEELFGIEKRIGSLLQVHELDSADNPIGPEAIGNAFMDALKSLDSVPVKVKLLLVMVFNKHMPSLMKSMYQDINQHMVDKGVMPKIRVGMKKQPTSSAREEAEQNAQTSKEIVAASQELFSTLQQLLTLGKGAAGVPAAGAPAGGQPAASPFGLAGATVTISPQVLNTLTSLQHGNIEGLLPAGTSFDASALTAGNINILREIKETNVTSVMDHVDAMTLDIVAMLFDYVLDDRNIPDALKALIGRLQIPVLKVAMLDKTFFSQKSHPARKFLDTLADAAIGWNEEEGHQSGLYKKVDDLVQRILNEFEDKVGVFGEVLDDLNAYLTEEKQRADEMTCRSAQLVQSKEQGEIGRILAHDEVRRRREKSKLPQVIRDFLSNHWENVMTAVYLHHGESSSEWSEALATMDDLVWSVAAKESADDRKKLVGMLPSLLKRLQQGLIAKETPQAERDQFFSKLVRCHADAVKTGMQNTLEEPVEVPQNIPEPVIEPAAEIEEIIPSAETQSSDPILLQQITAAPLPADLALEEIPVGNWQQADGDDFDAMVARLKRGSWLEFTQKDGSTKRNKLAWVSPLKGLLLFTNRVGSRALSITPAALAAKLRKGEAQIINDSALVDRAVNDLMDRLQQNTAAA